MTKKPKPRPRPRPYAKPKKPSYRALQTQNRKLDGWLRDLKEKLEEVEGSLAAMTSERDREVSRRESLQRMADVLGREASAQRSIGHISGALDQLEQKLDNGRLHSRIATLVALLERVEMAPNGKGLHL